MKKCMKLRADRPITAILNSYIQLIYASNDDIMSISDLMITL